MYTYIHFTSIKEQMTTCNFLRASFFEGASIAWLQATFAFYSNNESWQAAEELFIVTSWETLEKVKC